MAGQCSVPGTALAPVIVQGPLFIICCSNKGYCLLVYCLLLHLSFVFVFSFLPNQGYTYINTVSTNQVSSLWVPSILSTHPWRQGGKLGRSTKAALDLYYCV